MRKLMNTPPALAVTMAAILMAGAATAGEVAIEAARAVPESGGRYTFHVTLAHGDTGWDHYADRWEVLAPDGAVLGTRVLLHPHEREQPFTRSLTGVAVPEAVSTVIIRAHDKVHGDSAQQFEFDLPE